MYKIHFPIIPNMGDLLNKSMLEELFSIQVTQTQTLKSNLSAIGSGLSGTQWQKNPKQRIKQIAYYPMSPKHHYVWGTGFISHNPNTDMPFYFKNMHFCSVRGELTKKRVEKILGRNLDIPTGDGGLLADRWVGNVNKKYEVGIIPHYKEKDHPLIPKLLDSYPNSTLIDLAGDPKDVVRRIAECEIVLSSSLHGLIISDSYHIPNCHIMLYKYGSRIMGDGYKYKDYYSSYGLEDNPIILDSMDWPSVNQIIDGYKIDIKQVDEKKNQIMSVFPTL